ncbi:glycosyltransferase [Streptomyces niger]|uniref:glycosyltransferase n=1 Tax=Streptomyces niger TaxID=66373 RepID=UPI00069CB6DF|nr:glycosyltransferase [Streptomyces niger]
MTADNAVLLVRDIVSRARTLRQRGSADPLARDLAAISDLPDVLGNAPVAAPAYEQVAAAYGQRPPLPVVAVLLTRNEEERIARTVACMAGDVDRIMVIDAESTDGTVEAAAGACGDDTPLVSVVREWQDDFAAQRNHAFELLESGWLLFIDADEQLAPHHSGMLRPALRALDHLLPDGSFSVSPRIVDVDSGMSYTHTGRGVRAESALRFRGRIHERLFAAGGEAPPTVRLDIDFLHHGYTAHDIAANGKRERDGRLIGLCRAEEPENPKWAFYAARETIAAGVTDSATVNAAYDAFRDSLQLYRNPELTDYETERFEEAWSLLCDLAIRGGDERRIAECLDIVRSAGRTAEAAYYASLLEGSRHIAGLSLLVDRLSAAAGSGGGAPDLLQSKMLDLQATLALACGRYDCAERSYAAALQGGGGDSARRTLDALRRLVDRLP